MGFRLRGATDYTTGTWISADGTPSPIAPGGFLATPLEVSDVDGRAVPTTWRVEVPSRGIEIDVAALNPNAWMDLTVSYWEGPVTATGSHPGRGYLEMTGYE
ncbi:MAG: lipocalin family protein [Pseudomonadota bacterium]